MKQERFRLRKEKDDLERIVDQQKHQYEITRDMIERINEHCHDIKHQIHSVSSSTDNESLKEYLGTLADHVMVYDMAIRTGEQGSRYCADGEGTALSGEADPVDLYGGWLEDVLHQALRYLRRLR